MPPASRLLADPPARELHPAVHPAAGRGRPGEVLRAAARAPALRFWAQVLAAWTLVGLFSGSRHYLAEISQGREPGWWRTLGMWLTCYYVWAGLTPAVLRLARRFPLQPGTWRRGLAVHVPASVAAALVYLLVTALAWPQIWWTPANRPSPDHLHGSMLDHFQHMFLASFHTEVLTYWGLLGLVQFADYYRRYRERELQTSRMKLQMSRLEASLTHAQLSALRMQLQPHFLFNTLNTISTLMHEEVEVANRMLVRLSELLRMTLESGESHVVPLRRELAFLERYLEIEQIRFEERLTVEMDVDPSTLEAAVPAFLLQPLVENAVRHAIAPRAAPGVIRIGAWWKDGALVLSVGDDGPGLLKGPHGTQGTGIGLANSRARLQQLYPGGDRMELLEAPGGGLEVRITLPGAAVGSAGAEVHP